MSWKCRKCLPSLLVSQEAYHQNVLADFDDFRCEDPSTGQSFQVPHFFLGPHLHHFARIVAIVTIFESMFASDIFVSIFKDKDGSLVDLESEMFALWRDGVVNISLSVILA